MKTYINGYDVQQTFGLEVINATTALMQYPERKASVQHDFPETNGLDIDLKTPRFSAREFTFNCVLSGVDVGNMQYKYFGLFGILKNLGTYKIFNDFLNIEIEAFYKKQINLSQIYRDSSDGSCYIKFDLLFGETDPISNVPDVYLVDDQNNFLVP